MKVAWVLWLKTRWAMFLGWRREDVWVRGARLGREANVGEKRGWRGANDALAYGKMIKRRQLCMGDGEEVWTWSVN